MVNHTTFRSIQNKYELFLRKQISPIFLFFLFYNFIAVVVTVVENVWYFDYFYYYNFSFSRYSFPMHQNYEAAIKATLDNSRAIIELHKVYTLIVCVCVYLFFFQLFIYLFGFQCKPNALQTQKWILPSTMYTCQLKLFIENDIAYITNAASIQSCWRKGMWK